MSRLTMIYPLRPLPDLEQLLPVHLARLEERARVNSLRIQVQRPVGGGFRYRGDRCSGHDRDEGIGAARGGMVAGQVSALADPIAPRGLTRRPGLTPAAPIPRLRTGSISPAAAVPSAPQAGSWTVLHSGSCPTAMTRRTARCPLPRTTPRGTSV